MIARRRFSIVSAGKDMRGHYRNEKDPNGFGDEKLPFPNLGLAPLLTQAKSVFRGFVSRVYVPQIAQIMHDRRH